MLYYNIIMLYYTFYLNELFSKIFKNLFFKSYIYIFLTFSNFFLQNLLREEYRYIEFNRKIFNYERKK